MLDETTGYVAVSEFDLITVDQFKTAIDDLTAEGMKQLVIDLRNNPGGILDSAVAMVDYLIPDDMMDFKKGEENRSLFIRLTETEKGKPIPLPMAMRWIFLSPFW